MLSRGVQLAELLVEGRNSLGSSAGKEMIMPVGDFYAWALQKMHQHPAKVSLVGLVAAFMEYVEGARHIIVDRARYTAYRDDPDFEIPPTSVETFELTFSLSFMEVRPQTSAVDSIMDMHKGPQSPNFQKGAGAPCARNERAKLDAQASALGRAP